MWQVRGYGGPSVETIAQNLRSVQERVTEAALKAGRDPASVEIVAVTKGFDTHVIEAAYSLGLRHFGENRVQEATAKYATRPDDIVLHMVGHLQRNKVKTALKIFDVIESVDSLSLARELERRLMASPRLVDVLLEVNVAGETTKFGFSVSEVVSAWGEISDLEHLRVQGLMTVAPVASDPEAARWVFRTMARLKAELEQKAGRSLPVLSMGMSDDFEVAIEEGATWVRLGRAIFGNRPEG